MRAVFAETRGGLGSGMGRSFSEVCFLGDFLRELVFEVPPLEVAEEDLALTREEAALPFLAFPFLADPLFVAVGEFFFASALALRRSRRWTLVTASINSSFRMLCQPGTE